ncbi:galactokinase [Niastella yeongjuensis]|uniref:Galactokinase n=1 Tax=Niastella yeongjuensis TaxID=354355 RepID=A0A1V9EXA8_9BACT|nr:galactokinase [Niastella yeongjuensis]OQP50758.1 galactokinase [Niastella yeongjuensis]SEN19264.1 galactokinase [Niastella yeongjuensis]
MIQKIQQAFRGRFNKEPLVIGAPGRVNLIGEHTDYNYGFVLPGAVDKRIYVAIAPNETNTVNVFASQFNESYSFSLDITGPQKGWMNYLLGVSYHIQQQGKKIGGVDLVIDGDIPVGAGMSSSAALCSAYGFALNELFKLGLSRMDLAFIGQKTEHTFVGVKCGIMDQFASLHGKKGHVMKLDCRSLEYEYIPFDFPEYKIVLVNSMVSHSLAGSEYNVRRQQCEEGVAILQKHYPEIKSLRDVEPAQLLQHQDELPPVVFDRCSFIVYEKERLLRGCDALKQNDLTTFGKLMYATHEGLSKKYAVSCTELDFLAECAQHISGVAGARMMGGGFGGCTINIVQTDAVDTFTQKIQAAFNGLFKITPDVYVTQIEGGTNILA